MIAIVNYGMGNITSVMNALEAIGATATIANEPAQLAQAQGIILPGVGAFGDGMAQLKQRGFIPALEHEVLAAGKPLLGICLGLQLLATAGNEHGRHVGLGWIPGEVTRIELPTDQAALRLPHIGWNDVHRAHNSTLYAGLAPGQSFYFVHSYVLRPTDPDVITGTFNYGTNHVASIQWRNIYATQFHPEKSHKPGLALLKNFADRVHHA